MKTRHVREGGAQTGSEPELAGGSGARVGAEPGEREVARAWHPEGERAGEKGPGGRDPDIEQYIDGGVSAQPKGGLSGGANPSSGRMQSALGGPPGTRSTVLADTDASGMTVVGDPNLGFDEQDDLRDLLPGESGSVASVAEDRTELDEYARSRGRTLEQIVPPGRPPSRAAGKKSKPAKAPKRT